MIIIYMCKFQVIYLDYVDGGIELYIKLYLKI